MCLIIYIETIIVIRIQYASTALSNPLTPMSGTLTKLDCFACNMVMNKEVDELESLLVFALFQEDLAKHVSLH